MFFVIINNYINDNTSNVLDISVYNDVPVYGKSGKGVIFDLLDDFTTTYGINFNKISYSVDSSSNGIIKHIQNIMIHQLLELSL